MYIGFYGYPPYSGSISKFFETNVNADIQCDRDYAYSSRKEKIFTLINK